MVRRISAIVPLLFITLLCVGCVEGGYLILEYLLIKTQVSQKQNSVAPLAKKHKILENSTQKHNYTIILQRNIFGEPPSLDTAGTVAKSDPEKDLKVTTLEIILKGTISAGEEDSRAVIYDKLNKKQDLYQEGDAIQDAFVKEILRSKIILSFKGKDEILVMSDTAGAAEPVAPIAVNPKAIHPKSGAVVPGVLRKPVRRIVKPQPVRPVRRIVGGGKDDIQPIE
jgi:type II secretory pathway component PulC